MTFGLLRDACSPGSKINTNPIYRTPFICRARHLLGPARSVRRAAASSISSSGFWHRYLTYGETRHRAATWLSS